MLLMHGASVTASCNCAVFKNSLRMCNWNVRLKWLIKIDSSLSTAFHLLAFVLTLRIMVVVRKFLVSFLFFSIFL